MELMAAIIVMATTQMMIGCYIKDTILLLRGVGSDKTPLSGSHGMPGEDSNNGEMRLWR